MLDMELYRLTDFILPLHILQHEKIASVIYEDGAVLQIPDLVNEFWVGVNVNDQLIGCYQFNQVSAVVWEFHVRILPKYRKKYSLEATIKAFRWATDNINGLNKIYGYVPEVFVSAAAHCEKVGMKKEAFIEGSYLWKGKIIGQIFFSITVEEIRRLVCQ